MKAYSIFFGTGIKMISTLKGITTQKKYRKMANNIFNVPSHLNNPGMY